MSKIYTLDGKLLTDTPEIRIGDKVYRVDNRQKTAKKLMQLGSGAQSVGDQLDEALKLAFGAETAREIDKMDLPFPAYQKLFELVMAAVTGEEPEEIAARFQGEKAAE